MNYLDRSSIGMPPKSDEIEVSIFGPGYGECVLIHVGESNWIIVDSCIDPASKKSAPLLYLEKIGIDPQTSVKQIIASHWHDDHIRGLSEIVEICSSADFVCSDAMKSKEFLTLASAYGAHSMMESPGVQEFHQILETLSKRFAGRERQSSPFKRAVADRILFRIDKKPQPNRGMSCEIHSLSPSDESVTKALLEITNLFPTEKSTKRRIAIKGPNHCSVVLWIKIEDVRILLGSDLEELGNQLSGWTAILNSETRPTGKASLFKIPHHGSENGEHHDVWSHMLVGNPYAVLTPFSMGNVSLPKASDVERISNYSDNAYITSLPQHKKSTTARPNTVNKSIKEIAGSLRFKNPPIGQVRMRLKTGDEVHNWMVDMFGEASSLSDLSK